MRFRVSIAGLMALVTLAGIGFASLRYATEWWASLVFTATLLGFALAAAYAVHRRGPRRAFWSAFVAFGSGYLVLAFGPWFETSIRPRLLTTKLLALAYPRVAQGTRGESPLRFSPDGRVHPVGHPEDSAGIWGPDASRPDRFQSIGHSLAALLLAAWRRLG